MRRHTRNALPCVGAALLAFAFAPAGSAAQPEAEGLFRTYCSRCHGIEGRGGEGPSLHRPELEHAATDEELFALIQTGIPGTGMPGTWLLSDAQIERLVAFVRGLGRVSAEPLPGDPARGAVVYDDNGCEACHVLAGKGRGIGPELTRIGLMRGLEHLRESLLEPQSQVSEDYLFLRAHLDGGTRIEGLRLNEDAFSLQLRDANGRFHSMRKSDLVRLDRLRNRSIMRSYRRNLSAAELDDLVSFLASRRGSSTPAAEAP